MSNIIWLDTYNQTDLFDKSILDKEIKRQQVFVVIGQFFEHLTASLFKAEVQKPISISSLQPDLLIWSQPNDIIIEVKGTHKQPLMDYNQILEYKKLTRSTFPYTRPKVFYCIYFYKNDRDHSKQTIARNGQTVGGVVEHLTDNIQSMLVIDINSLITISGESQKYKYGQPWCGDRRDHYIRWKTPVGELFRYGTKLTASLAVKQITDKKFPITIRQSPSISLFPDVDSIPSFPIICLGSTKSLISRMVL